MIELKDTNKSLQSNSGGSSNNNSTSTHSEENGSPKSMNEHPARKEPTQLISGCNNNNNSTSTHSREDDGTEEKGKLNSLLLCIKILYIILFTNFCISRLKFSDKKKKKR